MGPTPGLPLCGPAENRRLPCHLTMPQRYNAQVDIIHVATPSSQMMKKKWAGRGDMQKTSLSHPGIFSLGNGSSFTVTFLQDNQRVSKDLQTVLWSSKTECKEKQTVLNFFWVVTGRMVRYRGRWMRRGEGSSAIYRNILWIFKINDTGEHRSSCYLLEAIKIKFCGTHFPPISRYPASSSVGYSILLYITVALKNWWHGLRCLQERDRFMDSISFFQGSCPIAGRAQVICSLRFSLPVYQGQTVVSRSSWPMIL